MTNSPPLQSQFKTVIVNPVLWWLTKKTFTCNCLRATFYSPQSYQQKSDGCLAKSETKWFKTHISEAIFCDLWCYLSAGRQEGALAWFALGCALKFSTQHVKMYRHAEQHLYNGCFPSDAVCQVTVEDLYNHVDWFLKCVYLINEIAIEVTHRIFWAEMSFSDPKGPADFLLI